MFSLRMGIPDMAALWDELTSRHQQNQLTKNEQKLFKKLVRALDHLRNDPRHPGLASHEISALTRRYGFKVWQSYLENNAPAAGRLFWAYGPDRGEITILGLEPHPEDAKRGAYERINLDEMPPLR